MIDTDEVKQHVHNEIEKMRGKDVNAIIIGEIHADPYHAAFKDLFVKKAKKLFEKPALLLEGVIAGDPDSIYAAIKYVPDITYIQEKLQELYEKKVIPKIPPLPALTKEDIKYIHSKIDSALKNGEIREVKYRFLKKYLQKILKNDEIYLRVRAAAGLTENIPIDGLEDHNAYWAALKAAKFEPASFKNAQERRNKAFAENIVNAASEGYIPIAIMGAAHVDSVKKILEKKGMRVHTVKINKVTISDEDLKRFEEILEERSTLSLEK